MGHQLQTTARHVFLSCHWCNGSLVVINSGGRTLAMEGYMGDICWLHSIVLRNHVLQSTAVIKHVRYTNHHELVEQGLQLGKCTTCINCATSCTCTMPYSRQLLWATVEHIDSALLHCTSVNSTGGTRTLKEVEGKESALQWWCI